MELVPGDEGLMDSNKDKSLNYQKSIDLIRHRSTYSGSGGSTQSDFELRTTLISQLSASEQRISSLESELRAAQLARGRAEQTVFDVNAEKLRLEAQNSEILQVNILRWSHKMFATNSII